MTRPHADLRGARILILEDDFYQAMDLQETLEQSGAQVVGPFSDAADAARAIERDNPDCAFVDLNLGNGPSFELPRALSRKNVPFAFVTGYSANIIPAEFGASARLEKPVEPSTIENIALRLLARS